MAEIVISHAFFVTEITATFDPCELHYSGFCGMTAYRLGKDELDNKDPEVDLLLKAFDGHIMTKTKPVF